MVDLGELRAEILVDPETIGLAFALGDQENADLLNVKNYIVDVVKLSSDILRSTVTPIAWSSLSISEQGYLNWIAGGGGRSGSDILITPLVKLALTGLLPSDSGVAGTGSDNDSMWGGGAGPRAAAAAVMIPLIEVSGSRAEVLWGEGVNVTAKLVSQAEALP